VILRGGRVVLPDRIIEGDIEVEGGKIERVGAVSSSGPSIDCSSKIIAPGLIDIHIHGCHGRSVMDGEIREMSEMLAGHGVTSFLPTTITAPEEELRAIVRKVSSAMTRSGGSEILGVNLEGPWVSRVRPGAQPLEYIRRGSIEEFERINDGSVRIVTLAPEDNLPIIGELSRRCIVSLGHSDADYETTKKAIDLGARLSTHTFNTMRPLHQREPGIIGAVLDDERVYCEFIPDLVHLHPAMIRILWRAKGRERAIAITDGTEASGLEDGVYDLSLGRIVVSKGKALREDGTIAGSAITLDACIKSLAYIGFSLPDIFRAAALNPAELLGIKSKGSISVGKDADLVVLDKDLNIEKVFVKGEELGR